jgi:hypothetical protein
MPGTGIFGMLDIVYNIRQGLYLPCFGRCTRGFLPIRLIPSDFLCLIGRSFAAYYELHLLIRF